MTEHASTAIPVSPKWDLDAVQRVLYHVVRKYDDWRNVPGGLPNEFMDNAIYDIAIPTLKDNGHWPSEDEQNGRSEP